MASLKSDTKYSLKITLSGALLGPVLSFAYLLVFKIQDGGFYVWIGFIFDWYSVLPMFLLLLLLNIYLFKNKAGILFIRLFNLMIVLAVSFIIYALLFKTQSLKDLFTEGTLISLPYLISWTVGIWIFVPNTNEKQV